MSLPRVLISAILYFTLFGQQAFSNDTGAIIWGDSIHPLEFDYRMRMAVNRLLDSNAVPSFTESFVLADVNINKENPRRFYNFSGDLSGRYLEVLSLTGDDNLKLKLSGLVKKIIGFQQPDGRFGNKALSFTEQEINGDHMALLWGNGRLLVGLMQYYKIYKDEAALAAARKLGDFFINAYQVCSSPTVLKRMEGGMAVGIICFTQYIEGLVLLSEFSKDPKYAMIAAKTYKILPPRGKQHSHGYLTTLRGILMLYQYDHQQAHLDFVIEQYRDLVNSDDYTAFGSVREYFGHTETDRDEGCSTSDFMRLSFELYKLTKEPDYFNRGEFALYNAFYFNQYKTGDFGHHILNNDGAFTDYMHASWWCCTMHGLRAMYEVKNNYATEEVEGGTRLNLYIETIHKNKNITFSVSRKGLQNGLEVFQISIQNCRNGSSGIFLRIPSYTNAAEISINGKTKESTVSNGYVKIESVKAGDLIQVSFKYSVKIMSENRNLISLNQLSDGKPVKGFLHYGPYLMGVDDRTDEVFTSEPNDNTVYLEHASLTSSGYYSVSYRHGGFPSNLSTSLKPVSELTFNGHGYLITRMSFSDHKRP